MSEKQVDFRVDLPLLSIIYICHLITCSPGPLLCQLGMRIKLTACCTFWQPYNITGDDTGYSFIVCKVKRQANKIYNLQLRHKTILYLDMSLLCVGK